MLRKRILAILVTLFAINLVACNGGGSSSGSSTPSGSSHGIEMQTPLDGTIGVGVLPTISFQFGESLVTNSVHLSLHEGSLTGATVDGYTGLGQDNQYTFKPSQSLTYGQLYYVVADAVGVDGVDMDGTFTFTVMDAPPTPSSATLGTIYYHGYVPESLSSAFQDYMTLTDNNYTDVIISNYIAGAMLGHLIDKAFPGIHYIRDYIFGTMYGQWLQENLNSSLYVTSSNLLAPSPLQASVMGVGQGGPYQINAYYFDMVAGTYYPQGHSLSNYAAIQKNIGYTLFTPPESQAAQNTKVTPAQFNDKFFGPMVTAYFHINDLISLESLENGSQGYISSAAPNYPTCMTKFISMPNAPLDVVMNYAYNQGYYGGLDKQITDYCVTMDEAAFLNKYNGSYNMANGDESMESSSYTQYPYQVRFYLDEMGNTSTLSPTTTNNLSFSMQEMKNIFTYVYQTIWYLNSSNQYLAITPAQAGVAFDTALSTEGVSISSVLNISDTDDRNKIFDVLTTAINTLETNLGTNFLYVSLTQLK